jgi:hypothetical protein
MSASGWMRRWKSSGIPAEQTSALLRASTRGDPLDRVLDVAVQSLLETSSADRAGLWLAGERRGESGWGRVIESKWGPVPEQWKHLDISTPFLRSALKSPEPLRVDFGRDDSMAPLGPLAGMYGAIWIPLRVGSRTLGLAMVGYTRSHAARQLDLQPLRACADKVALAVAHHRDARQKELAAEELRSLGRLSRAILCGVSVESILPQIARAARHHLQAEFVALGRPSASHLLAESWDGPEEWRAPIQQQPFLHLWHKVLEEGREAEIGGETLPAPPVSATNQARPHWTA